MVTDGAPRPPEPLGLGAGALLDGAAALVDGAAALLDGAVVFAVELELEQPAAARVATAKAAIPAKPALLYLGNFVSSYMEWFFFDTLSEKAGELLVRLVAPQLAGGDARALD